MPTIIRFNSADAEGPTSLAVDESPDEVQNAWELAHERFDLLHLTRVRPKGVPVRVHRAAVAYWYERKKK